MAETSEERLTRLDAEFASELAAEKEAAADAELARLFPNLAPATPVAPPADPRARKPRGEGAFAKFRRQDAARRATEAAEEAATEADIAADEQGSDPTFLQKAAAPATDALSGARGRLDLAIEGSDELQRLKNAQSTDAQN